MKLISYNSFGDDLRHEGICYAAEHAARLGFAGVETLDFLPAHRKAPIYREFPADELRRALEGNGLEVACHSVALGRCDLDTDAVLDGMYRHIEYAAALGSPFLHHTLILSLKPLSEPISYGEMLSRIVPTAVKIAERCTQYGMACIYEPQGMYFNGIEGLGSLLEAVRAQVPHVGVCGDLGNSLFVDEAPVDIVRRFGGDIRHVHVKDYLRYDPSASAGQSGNRSRGGALLVDCALGEGVCEIATCLSLLREAGYTGAYSLELNGDDDATRRAMRYLQSL